MGDDCFEQVDSDTNGVDIFVDIGKVVGMAMCTQDDQA
jgi:hypothetical protein